MAFARIQLHWILRKPSDQVFTNLFQGSYYILDFIYDRKRGIIICIASKVDYLQYQEHVAHKNKNKEGSRIELYGTPDKISSEEWKKESTLNFCWQFDK